MEHFAGEHHCPYANDFVLNLVCFIIIYRALCLC